MDRYLITTGGVGTYAIRDAFGEKNLNRHNGYSPHTRDPSSIKGPARVLYVFGNPYNQTLSFHRRGFMQSPYRHCKNVDGNLQELRKRRRWRLTDYIANGVDCFQLRGHLRGWMKYTKREYEIMFVRYETLPQHLDEIKEWWQLPCKRFRFKKRKSNWTMLHPDAKKDLRRMFGRAHAQMKALPDIMTKGSGQ